MLEMKTETTNRKCSIEKRSWKYRKIHGKALESFLVKILAIRATVIAKTQSFSCDFYQVVQNNPFTQQLQATTSVKNWIYLLNVMSRVRRLSN